MSRRPGFIFNRGRIATVAGVAGPPPPPTTPLTILGANTLQWCRGDLGVTIGTGVSAWADQSGNGFDYAHATGAAQPAFGATDGPNGTPALTFDGVDDSLLAPGLTLAAPGTTPTWIWMVFKQITWLNTRRLFAATSSSNTHTVFHNGASPTLAAFNGVTANNNAEAAVGTWVAAQFYYSSSVGDFIRVNDNLPVTGTSAGNNAGGVGRTLGSGNAALFSNIATAEIVYANVLPTNDQVAAFSAYRLARYGF